jgi:hypothetical protein
MAFRGKDGLDADGADERGAAERANGDWRGQIQFRGRVLDEGVLDVGAGITEAVGAAVGGLAGAAAVLMGFIHTHSLELAMHRGREPEGNQQPQSKADNARHAGKVANKSPASSGGIWAIGSIRTCLQSANEFPLFVILNVVKNPAG